MICSHCGREIPENSKYCSFCGRNLSKAENLHSEKAQLKGIYEFLYTKQIDKEWRKAYKNVGTKFIDIILFFWAFICFPSFIASWLTKLILGVFQISEEYVFLVLFLGVFFISYILYQRPTKEQKQFFEERGARSGGGKNMIFREKVTLYEEKIEVAYGPMNCADEDLTVEIRQWNEFEDVFETKSKDADDNGSRLLVIRGRVYNKNGSKDFKMHPLRYQRSNHSKDVVIPIDSLHNEQIYMNNHIKEIHYVTGMLNRKIEVASLMSWIQCRITMAKKTF